MLMLCIGKATQPLSLIFYSLDGEDTVILHHLLKQRLRKYVMAEIIVERNLLSWDLLDLEFKAVTSVVDLQSISLAVLAGSSQTQRRNLRMVSKPCGSASGHHSRGS